VAAEDAPPPPPPAKPPAAAPVRNPELLVLHVRANRTGAIRDIELEQLVGGAPVLATIDPEGLASATPPKATWGDQLGKALAGFTKQRDFATRYLVRVAPDAGLKMKNAADVHDYCLSHGFANVEFADTIQAVAVRINADGRATVDGRRVTPDEVKDLLVERATAVGSIDKVAVTLYVHPDVDYGVVAAMLRRTRDWAGDVRIRPLSEADK
jgi:hypothetical protein